MDNFADLTPLEAIGLARVYPSESNFMNGRINLPTICWFDRKFQNEEINWTAPHLSS
jgi:hypothetical protein